MEKNAPEWEKVKTDFKEWYFENEQKFQLMKDMYQSLITSLLFDRNEISNPQIESRVKDRKSAIEKFERKYLSNYTNSIILKDVTSKITDFVGIRIICSYEDEIHIVEEIIKKNFTVIDKTDKTRDLVEKQKFGYKGVHLDVVLSDDRKKLDEYKKISSQSVEIQIRSLIQHAWSSLDHKIIYKKEKSPEIQRAIERLAALFEIADSEFIRLRDETIKQEKISEDRIKAIEKDKTNSEKSTTLDFITFNKFLSMKFKYNFYEYRTNSMLDEIYRCNPEFDLIQLTESYDTEHEKVEKYKKDNEKILSMNPYTMLRHMLYAFDQEKYNILLTEIQRKNFDDFINQIT